MRDGTIVLRNMLRRKLRLGLLLVSVAIAFLLYGLLVSFGRSVTGATIDAGTNRLIVANKINFTQPLPISYIDRVRAVPGVARATYGSWFGGYYRDPKNFVVSFAVDFASYFAVYSELAMPDAQLEECQRTRNGIAVGQTLADTFGWKPGQALALQTNLFQRADGSRQWEYVVCGIFTDTQKTGADSAVYFSWDYLNETRAPNRDTIGLITLVPDESAAVPRVAETIDRQFANSAAETDTVTERQFAAAFASQFGDIALIINLVVGSAFATILLIVGTTMATAVRERTREIGILKTLGFPVGRIALLVLGEAMLVATIGGLIGLTLARLALASASRLPSFAGLRMGAEVWASGLLWMALLGLLTALLPTAQALRISIVTALGRR